MPGTLGKWRNYNVYVTECAVLLTKMKNTTHTVLARYKTELLNICWIFSNLSRPIARLVHNMITPQDMRSRIVRVRDARRLQYYECSEKEYSRLDVFTDCFYFTFILSVIRKYNLSFVKLISWPPCQNMRAAESDSF